MDAATLARAMGNARGVDYGALVGPFNEAMLAAGITNVNRAAMWCAQLGHESVGLSALEEYASGSAYEWRADLGNNRPGDGVRYKGRGAIMVTGRSNYRNLSRWAHGKGYVPTATYFEDNPAMLQSSQHAFIGAIWYWTVARPQLNALSDARNLDGATRAINGGTNGIVDRRARYNNCLTLGDALLPAPTGKVHTVEKRLDYPRQTVTQDTPWFCGPASVQTAIAAKTGRVVDENALARELGTHVGGTDWIGQFPPVLNRHLPGADYRVQELAQDPPTSAQRDLLWDRIVNAVDGGYGVVTNIVSPESNRPRPSYTSRSPLLYGSGTIYHYFLVAGYAVDERGTRHVWIADSGFSPYGSWITLHNLATLIPPKGYAYPAKPAPKPAPPIKEDPIMDRIKSGIDPRKTFSAEDVIGFIDTATWQMRVVLYELARKQGLDPKAIVDQAIAEERAKPL